MRSLLLFSLVDGAAPASAAATATSTAAMRPSLSRWRCTSSSSTTSSSHRPLLNLHRHRRRPFRSPALPTTSFRFARASSSTSSPSAAPPVVPPNPPPRANASPPWWSVPHPSSAPAKASPAATAAAPLRPSPPRPPSRSSIAAKLLSEAYSPESVELIRKYGKKKPTSASLETLMKTGRGELLSKYDVASSSAEAEADDRVLMQVANFLRRELPVRLAHRIQDLSRVPYMRDMDSVRHVRDVYVDSLRQLSSVPRIESPADEASFACELERLYGKHSNVLMQMARGAFELRAAMRKGRKPGSDGAADFEGSRECHTFLDRFYMSRIGIRVLAGQYLALRRSPPLEDHIGMICHRTSPHQLVLHAADDASLMCQRKYGDSPEVIVSGNLDLTFPYVPAHLHYILLELLKNAMRATVEQHAHSMEMDSDKVFPPVRVVIADGHGNEDVVVKVSDEGGGIPRSHMKKIWSYLFTTADPSVQEGLVGFANDGAEDHSVDSPLAGLGYGLPISRSYARYFGGDMSVMSMEGYGTDAFVYLRRLGDSKEPLPV